MNSTPGSNPLTDKPGRLGEIRSLNRHLVSAQDAKILKVVAMVDALPVRGDADSLIAPLRPRLAQLRPRRPLSAQRLLFTPLDPVLVPPAQWRRGALTIPRTAVGCLIRQFTALDPALMEAVAQEVAGGSFADVLLSQRAGARLWARAAALLAAEPPPADWAEATGLADADYRAIRDAAVLVLRHAPAMSTQLNADPLDADVITRILTEAAFEPDGLGVLISVMLYWLPGSAAQVLDATSAHAAPTGLPGRTATERAVEHVLENIEAEQEASKDGVAGLPRLRRTIAMLDQLEASSTGRPTRSARINATRARVDSACRIQFQTMVQNQVTSRLAGGLPQAPDEIAAFEATARDIRRFEGVARRISGSDHYDRQLRTVVDGLAPNAGDDSDSRVDRLRLAEILLGPEKALQMLMEAEKPAKA